MLALGLALFGLYHCLHPSGHALNQVSTNTLDTLSDPTFTYSKAYVHQQEGPHKHWALAWVVGLSTLGVDYQCFEAVQSLKEWIIYAG